MSISRNCCDQLLDSADLKGFICGWTYWFAYVVGVAVQLVNIGSIVELWQPTTKVPPEVWVVVFYLVVILFNCLNVRRYGEFEYILTVVKIATIVGLIIMGILLSMGASEDNRQLGTSSQNTTLSCSNPLSSSCLPDPGFGCISSLSLFFFMRRD